MAKPRLRLLLAAAGAMTLMAGCATDSIGEPTRPQRPVDAEERQPMVFPRAPVPERDRIRIALLAPLSGPNARVGEAIMNAAELALFDARDPRIVLTAYDTEATPDRAAAAARAAVDDAATVILGPLFSASVQAVAPITRAAQVPVIAFSNDPAAAASGIYLMGLQPAQEVKRVIDYAVQGRGLDRLAALTPRGTYGETVLAAFGAAAIDAGAAIKAIEIYTRDASAMTAPVKAIAEYDKRARWLAEERAFLTELNDDLAVELLEKLANQETLTQPDYDAILIAEGGQLLRTLAPLLAIYEVDPLKVRFLGTGLWNDAGLVREPPLHGAWFAAPPEDGFRAFAARYLEAFDRPPARVAALSYDAMAMVALLARNTMVDERFSAAAITDPNGYAGVGGIFRFAPNGIAERGFTVLEIRPEGFKMLSPAPTTFERPVYTGMVN